MSEEATRRQEVAVGVFVLAAIAGLVFLSFRIGGGRPAHAARYSLLFDSALGLQRDNIVTVAGVKVGVVDDIRVSNRRAQVDIAIDPDLAIFQDATAAVRSRTLLGEKHVDLDPGTPGTARLAPGATIDKTIPTVEIDHVIRGAQEIIDRANTILPTLQAAVEKIDGLVRRSDAEATARSLGEVLDETAALIRSVGNLSRTAGEDLRVVLATLRQRGPEILNRIESSAARIDALAAAVPTESMTDAIQRAPKAFDNAEHALADLRDAVADLRTATRSGADIATVLQRVLHRIDRIDEQSMREFMQVQGVRVVLTPTSTILRRVQELKNREMPVPIPEEE